MDLEGIKLSEVSQTEKDKYRGTSLTCRIFKKTKNSQKQRSDLWLSEVRAGGDGRKWGKVAPKYKLPVRR